MDKNLMELAYEGKQVRTVLIDGEPWWVLKDVCDVLDMTGTAGPTQVAKRLRDKEKKRWLGDDLSTTKVVDGKGRKQGWLLVNEFGLYSTILLSRKEEALRFKDWITDEVLPSIRKTGGYFNGINFNDPWAAQEAYAHQLLREAALAKENKKKAELLLEAKPKIEAFDHLVRDGRNHTVGEVAKALYKFDDDETGRNKLMDRLREAKLWMKKHGTQPRLPKQVAIAAGLFKVKEFDEKGNKAKYPIVEVTPKGMGVILDLYKQHKESAQALKDITIGFFNQDKWTKYEL